MNILSSILTFIANKIGSSSMETAASTITGAIGETYRRTRLCFIKGTHTINSSNTSAPRLYGVTGYMGSGNNLTLFIPMNIASNVSDISFANFVASIRTTSGGYVYSTTDSMHTLISSVSICSKQPLVRMTLNSSSFSATANTPVSGEVTAAKFTLT